MICPTCHGKGVISSPHIPDLGLWSNSPCPECGGCGISHCCSGDDLPVPPTDRERKDDGLGRIE